MKVVVVGGGFGGMLSAARLAQNGHEVTLIERSDRIGGKLAGVTADGFRFDSGPSLLTLPDTIGEVWAASNRSFIEEAGARRLSNPFRLHWSDGSHLSMPAHDAEWYDELDRFSPGAAQGWHELDRRGNAIWSVAERTFLAGPMDPTGLRDARPGDLAQIDSVTTLHRRAAALFSDRRLVQLVGRYATYSGSSPFSVPATMLCIPHIERVSGAWHVDGGLATLVDHLESLLETLGVCVRTSTAVDSVSCSRRRATGITTTVGEHIAADVVVADVDARHLYRDLSPSPRHLKRLQRVPRSQSCIVVHLAVSGRTHDVAHHNVWFSADQRQEFAALGRGRLPADPTVYACVPTVTDPSMSPIGDESWTVLIVAPPEVRADRSDTVRWVTDLLAARGVDLRNRIRFSAVVMPNDIAARSNAVDGAIYGSSSNGRLAAFRRPGNRGPIEGLYLVGGSAHPGGGLPMVSIGSRIVAELIEADHGP